MLLQPPLLLLSLSPKAFSFRSFAPSSLARFSSSSSPTTNSDLRNWTLAFKKHLIPPTAYSLSFARSSGPGGQNVNKVSTKVILRFPLPPSVSFLPDAMVSKLKEQQANRITKSNELIITSDKYRSQRANIDDALQKLHDIIVQAGQVEKETTKEQRQRVRQLQKAHTQERLTSKLHQSRKKSDRKAPKKDW
ncbi:RF-1 domain-containing protein [Paraphysoderma sedebokerense]|nr:RF-1 domain-containing protein [Paraphysoderma sedebokerense]